MKFLERCYSRNPSIISKAIGETVFLVPMQDNLVDLENIYTLESVGARIWELIDGRRSVKQIKEILTEEFEENPKQIEDDLVEIFKQLENRHFIKVKNLKIKTA